MDFICVSSLQPTVEQEAHGAEISIQISALAGVEPWHLAAANITTRLPHTPSF